MRIIAGEARGRTIEAPPGSTTRPTLDRVRENLFNMIQGEVRDRSVLDLFAGSGALSLEALSRGAAFAVLADRDRRACETQKKNIGRLGYEARTQIISGDWRPVLERLRREGRRFDLVFLDPPYAMSDTNALITSLAPVIDDRSLIVLEHEASRSIPAPDGFVCEKERSWGYCGISLYRLKNQPDRSGEEI